MNGGRKAADFPLLRYRKALGTRHIFLLQGRGTFSRQADSGIVLHQQLPQTSEKHWNLRQGIEDT